MEKETDEEVNRLYNEMKDVAAEMEVSGKTYSAALCLGLANQIFTFCGKDIAKQDERLGLYIDYIRDILRYNGARDAEGTGRDKENPSLQ